MSRRRRRRRRRRCHRWLAWPRRPRRPLASRGCRRRRCPVSVLARQTWTERRCCRAGWCPLWVRLGTAARTARPDRRCCAAAVSRWASARRRVGARGCCPAPCHSEHLRWRRVRACQPALLAVLLLLPPPLLLLPLLPPAAAARQCHPDGPRQASALAQSRRRAATAPVTAPSRHPRRAEHGPQHRQRSPPQHHPPPPDAGATREARERWVCRC